MNKLEKYIIAFLGLLFIIATPIIIYYAKGYKFDFASKKFIITGGLFLKSSQPANIFINGKFKQKTSRLFNEVINNKGFISGLLPGKYDIELQKENFNTWHKNLEITAGLVTEAKNIILIPKITTIEKINNYNPNYNFYIKKKGIFLYINNERQIESLNINDDKINKIQTNDNTIIIDKFITASNNGNQILAVGFKKSQRIWILITINDNKAVLQHLIVLNDITPENLQKAAFDQTNETNLFFGFQKNLFQLNIITGKLTKIIENLSGWAQNKNLIYYINNYDSLLYQIDINDNIIKKISRNPLPSSINSLYEISIAGENIIILELTEGGYNRLFRVNPENILEKISDQTNIFKISNNNEKILINNNTGTNIYFMKITTNQPIKFDGETAKINNIKNLTDAIWLTPNENHIIYSYNNKIEFSEIDDRDYINSTELLLTPNAKFIDIKNEWLYFYNQNGIFKLKIF